MAWCPKCKDEYVEGITTCPACGSDLVDELPKKTDQIVPVVICQVPDEQIGAKFVMFLQYNGVQTAGLMPVEESDEEQDGGFNVVVASFEEEIAKKAFAGFDSSEILPEVEQQLSDIKNEEANKVFSELRTEQSTVYVKKRDKYADLKFSGISFLVFALLGVGVLVLNILGYISILNNKFSAFIMGIVFLIFFVVGITSLVRAKKMKGMVSQEERMSNDVLIWLEENITDEWLNELYDEEQTEESNYFTIHEKMCEKTALQFPLINRTYIEQLMDERYNEYCEER